MFSLAASVDLMCIVKDFDYLTSFGGDLSYFAVFGFVHAFRVFTHLIFVLSRYFIYACFWSSLQFFLQMFISVYADFDSIKLV